MLRRDLARRQQDPVRESAAAKALKSADQCKRQKGARCVELASLEVENLRVDLGQAALARALQSRTGPKELGEEHDQTADDSEISSPRNDTTKNIAREARNLQRRELSATNQATNLDEQASGEVRAGHRDHAGLADLT
jgi:hypothetical protein